MRILAILFNLLLLGVFIFMFATEGSPIDWGGWLMAVSISLAPILSIVALVMNCKGGKSFIGLWFARKALEEKKKIEKLQSQKTSE